MLINKKMHEARVKAIRDAVNDESNVYYIFRKEKSWEDGCMQWCETYITSSLDEVKAYVDGLKDVVKDFNLLTDIDEFEKGETKTVRGFTPLYTAISDEIEPGSGLPCSFSTYYAGYIRKIEKERK